MATVQVIPTANDPFYRQVTALSGIDYQLEFAYNQREDCWYMTIGDNEGNVMFQGLKLVVGWPIFAGLRHANLPPGQLVVISNTISDDTPGLDDLAPGARCELCYITE
jgi:hypothetical protein